MALTPDDLLKLVLAVVLGGLVGAEREYRDKAAGFRTIILICVGATLFTMLSLKMAGTRGDPARIAAGIVSGIGFLGAGAILRGGRHIVGLTTASTIWVAAALGMGIGSGRYLLSVVVAAVVLTVLFVFPRIEVWIDRTRESRTYEVTAGASVETCADLEALLREKGLRIRHSGRRRSGAEMICRWDAIGPPAAHEGVMDELLEHPDISGFRT
jgi:putative Mg2+ transporter-C (MgtC) family protein